MLLKRRGARRRPFAKKIFAGLVAALLIALGGLLFLGHIEAGPAVFEVASPTSFRKDASIIFLSGDTGLRSWSLGGRVAQQLAAAGYAVTGVDTFVAFSEQKTPEQTAELLARAMLAADARNPGGPIVLMGQSFGSDILPIAVDRLPPTFRARISKIILIVPGSQAYLRVSPGEIAGIAPADVDLAPLALRLPNVPITCIYGIKETDSLCPVFSHLSNAAVIGMPGGHPLDRDAKAVFTVVSRALRTPAT